MVLTVDKLYKILSSMFESDYLKNKFFHLKLEIKDVDNLLDYKDFILYDLQNTGSNLPLFYGNISTELLLYQNNGRIYYVIMNIFINKPVGCGFLTNEILSKFKLSSFGEEFIEDFL